jgi:hypothetical protein
MSRYNNWRLLNVDAVHNMLPTTKSPKWSALAIFQTLWSHLSHQILKSAKRGVLLKSRGFTYKHAIRDISKTVLLNTETQFQKHLSLQITPQKLGKITLKTTFFTQKCFWSLLRLKTQFT